MSGNASSAAKAIGSGKFWKRLALPASILVMLGVIWASQAYLTRTFTEAQAPDAKLRATLYGNAIVRLSRELRSVPFLLSLDPILIYALRSGEAGAAQDRLQNFSQEIDDSAISLLDAEGVVIAASDPDRVGSAEGDRAFFTQAVADTGTVFSITQGDPGGDGFYYARKVVDGDEVLGVIAVEVDFDQLQEGWRLGRNKVLVTSSDGRVVLASEPAWRDRPVGEVLSTTPEAAPIGQAVQSVRARINPSSYVYIDGVPHLPSTSVGFRDWTLTYLSTLENVRARVNSVLALAIMSLAILIALGFYMLSRRTRAESRRIKTESTELRALNRRLSLEISARQKVERTLKDAEQSLEQASKLAALGQMSAAVSHELNQPLAAMKTYLAGARLLLHRNRPDEALSSFQRINDLIDRMGGITRQLKSYARKGDVDLDEFDLRDSVRAALSMMAPQLGKITVNMTVTMPSEPVIVRADPLRIEQIVVNLLRNALDAVKGRDDRQIKILLVEGETVLLSVEDNGEGLKEPGKLFEPFYTTKKPGEGLGLGLAISAGFAAELGGRLVARNAPGGGAVFELILPSAQDLARAAE